MGSNRSKVGRFGGDAPSAREVRAEDDDENLRAADSFEPVPVKKGQRKKGASSGHETGLGGRPRKLGGTAMEEEWRGEAGSRQMVSLGGGSFHNMRAWRRLVYLLFWSLCYRMPPVAALFALLHPDLELSERTVFS